MSKEFDGWENIDWGVEIDTLEFDLMAIKSHNKSNPNVGNIGLNGLKICWGSYFYH